MATLERTPAAGRIRKAFNLKSHQVGTFELSNDPQLVLCVGEKLRIQALDRCRR